MSVKTDIEFHQDQEDFKDHKLVKYEIIDNCYEIFEYQIEGTIQYGLTIIVLIRNGTIIISGDYGHATYSFYRANSKLKDIFPSRNLNYFMGKCTSDSSSIKGKSWTFENMKNCIKKKLLDKEDVNSKNIDLHLENLLDISEINEYYLCNNHEWIDFVNYNYDILNKIENNEVLYEDLTKWIEEIKDNNKQFNDSGYCDTQLYDIGIGINIRNKIHFDALNLLSKIELPIKTKKEEFLKNQETWCKESHDGSIESSGKEFVSEIKKINEEIQDKKIKERKLVQNGKRQS